MKSYKTLALTLKFLFAFSKTRFFYSNLSFVSIFYKNVI